MDSNDRFDHIEDVLVRLHTGQWFGWTDSKDKVYANLVIYNSDYDKPTEKSLTDALSECIAAYPLQELRDKRNALLAESDWWASSDLVISDERKTYRQALRDLTAGIDSVEKVKAVTWPEKPE